MRKVDDAWQVVWSPALVEPSLTKEEVLDATSITSQARGPPRCPRAGAGRRTLGRRYGIDRSQVPKAQAGESARQLATLAGIDVAPYVKQVEAAGDKAFVEAIIYRIEEVPPAFARDFDDIPGAVAVADELPLAPTREFAAPILGTVGEVTAEMIEKDPDRYQAGDVAGLSGLQARYDDQLRGTPGVVVDAVSGRRRGARAVPRGAGGRAAARADPRHAACSWLPRSCSPTSVRRARWSRSGRRPATSWWRPTAPATTATTWRRSASSLPGRRSRASARWRCCATASRPTRCCRARTGSSSTARRSRTTTTTPPEGSARSRCGRRSPTPATPPSSPRPTGSPTTRSPTPPPRWAWASTTTLGFPAYFGSVEPPESETEKAADMIGQGTILASPMAMATVAASIQSGTTVLPRLVTDVGGRPGRRPRR